MSELFSVQFTSDFQAWLTILDDDVQGRFEDAFRKIRGGNFGGSESVGGGVYELKIHFGPGYRGYFGKSGKTIVVMIAGSTKKRQQKAIRQAQELWKVIKKQ